MELRLGGTHELADLLGVTRQRVHQLSSVPGFPKPVAVIRAGAIWDLETVDQWRTANRTMTNRSPNVPPRDPDRPQDDPWDADAVRYLMRFTDKPRGWLMEHLRGQRRLERSAVDQARELAAAHGVRCEAHADGRTVHFFRSDADAPTPYPASEAERRTWRAAAHN